MCQIFVDTIFKLISDTMAPKNKDERKGGQRGDRRGKERKSGRKGKKMNQWREEKMRGAIEEFKTVEAGKTPRLRLLAKAWNVPKSTLQRRVKGIVKGSRHYAGRSTMFSPDGERELADLIKLLAQRGFPLKRVDVQEIDVQNQEH